MADDLGKDGQWRDTVETRLGKAEFGAQRELLQALHVTQQEHTAQFREMREEMQKGREETQKGFERLHAGVDAIVGLLGGEPSTND